MTRLELLDSATEPAGQSLGIPTPKERPTLSLWPETGTILGLGRSATYAAAERGEIPTLEFGRRKVVPTAALRRLLAIDQ